MIIGSYLCFYRQGLLLLPYVVVVVETYRNLLAALVKTRTQVESGNLAHWSSFLTLDIFSTFSKIMIITRRERKRM